MCKHKGSTRGEVPAVVSGPSPQREHLLTASSVPQPWTRGLGNAGAQTPVGELCHLPWRGGLSSPDVLGPVPPMPACLHPGLGRSECPALGRHGHCAQVPWASPVSQRGPLPALPQEGLPPSQETSELPYGCASGQSWKPITGQTPPVPTWSLKHRPPLSVSRWASAFPLPSLCVGLCLP